MPWVLLSIWLLYVEGHVYAERPRAQNITCPTGGVANAFVWYVYASVSGKFTDQSLHWATVPQFSPNTHTYTHETSSWYIGALMWPRRHLTSVFYSGAEKARCLSLVTFVVVGKSVFSNNNKVSNESKILFPLFTVACFFSTFGCPFYCCRQNVTVLERKLLLSKQKFVVAFKWRLWAPYIRPLLGDFPVQVGQQSQNTCWILGHCGPRQALTVRSLLLLVCRWFFH